MRRLHAARERYAAYGRTLTRTLARESKPSIYFDGLRAPALRLPLETANGEAAGPAAFFTCLGFFGSRPLRF